MHQYRADVRIKRREDGKLEASPTPPLGVHIFRLTWDTSRERNQRQRSREKQHATGVKFDETGIVALSNGQTFENVDTMEHLLGLAGEYATEWEQP